LYAQGVILHLRSFNRDVVEKKGHFITREPCILKPAPTRSELGTTRLYDTTGLALSC